MKNFASYTGIAFARRGLIAGLAALTTVALVGAAAAQSSRATPDAEWTKIVEAAKKEGKIVLYATMAPAVHDRIVAAFNAEYPGIKMELVRVVGTAMTIKIEQERQSQNVVGADAMLTADVRWAMDAAGKGYLKPIVGPHVAAFPDKFFKDDKILFPSINPWVMTYNTNLVKTPITSYQDLLRPELKGKIGSTSLVAEVVSIWHKWVDDNNPGLFDKLAEQNVKMYASSVAAGAATASGEIFVNAFSVIPIDQALLAQKAPIKTVITNPVLGFSYGAAALSWAKNPNAALVAVDFLASPKGQAALVGKEEAASPLPNIPGSLDLSKHNMQIVDWDKMTPESLKTFEARWNKLFGAR